jgi:NUMOD4 motif
MPIGEHSVNLEDFRPVPGYEGIYEISPDGRVLSLARVIQRGGRWRQPQTVAQRIIGGWKQGRYRRIMLVGPDGRHHKHYLHVLVREAFGTTTPGGG